METEKKMKKIVEEVEAELEIIKEIQKAFPVLLTQSTLF